MPNTQITRSNLSSLRHPKNELLLPSFQFFFANFCATAVRKTVRVSKQFFLQTSPHFFNFPPLFSCFSFSRFWIPLEMTASRHPFCHPHHPSYTQAPNTHSYTHSVYIFMLFPLALNLAACATCCKSGDLGSRTFGEMLHEQSSRTFCELSGELPPLTQ